MGILFFDWLLIFIAQYTKFIGHYFIVWRPFPDFVHSILLIHFQFSILVQLFGWEIDENNHTQSWTRTRTYQDNLVSKYINDDDWNFILFHVFRFKSFNFFSLSNNVFCVSGSEINKNNNSLAVYYWLLLVITCQ